MGFECSHPTPKLGGSEGFTVMRSWGQLLMDGISALLRDPRRAYLSLFVRVKQNVYEYWALTRYLTFNFSALRTIGNKFLLFIAFATPTEWCKGPFGREEAACFESCRATAHLCFRKAEQSRVPGRQKLPALASV